MKFSFDFTLTKSSKVRSRLQFFTYDGTVHYCLSIVQWLAYLPAFSGSTIVRTIVLRVTAHLDSNRQVDGAYIESVTTPSVLV